MALLAFGGCGDADPSARATTTTTAESNSTTTEFPPLDGDTPISWEGIGFVKAGMTLAEVRDVARRELVLDGFEGFGGYCWFADFEGLEDDFSLLFLSPARTEPVDNPNEGVLGRVSTYGDIDDSPARTETGIGIGSSKAEVMAAYSSDVVEVTPHFYVDGGEYIDVSGTQDPVPTLLRFETDASGTVTAIHGGLPDAVRLIEGCA